MAGRGRPAAPVEQKRRRGTLRPDRVPNAGSLAVVPALDVDAWELSPAEALERVLSEGVHWIARTDSPHVALLLDALKLLERAKAGSVRDEIEAQKHVASLLGELGFNPSARSKLGLAEVKAQSKLEEIRARRAQREAGVVDADDGD